MKFLFRYEKRLENGNSSLNIENDSAAVVLSLARNVMGLHVQYSILTFLRQYFPAHNKCKTRVIITEKKPLNLIVLILYNNYACLSQRYFSIRQLRLYWSSLVVFVSRLARIDLRIFTSAKCLIVGDPASFGPQLRCHNK